MLAVAHPWASASSYLSSQSLADSHYNLHASCHLAVVPLTLVVLSLLPPSSVVLCLIALVLRQRKKRLLRAARARRELCLTRSRAAICVTHGGFCHLSIGSTFYAHLPGKGAWERGRGRGRGWGRGRAARGARAQQRVGWGRRRGGGGGGGGGGGARVQRCREELSLRRS